MMHMEHRLSHQQRQSLVLTQKMQQALQVLQLSSMELEQHVLQELETNPFLEQEQRQEEPPEPKADDQGAKTEEDSSFEEAWDLDAYADKWREGQDLSRNRDMDARRDYYENSITKEESLSAHLLTQLHLIAGDDVGIAIGERIIIGDIDDKGYFTGDTAEIAAELDLPVEVVDDVLAHIRQFEPTGIGARNVVDCLLMQIEAEYPNEEALKILVRDHFEALTLRQIPQIAKEMGIKPERVEELKNILSTLNPWPGHEFSTSPPQYITPEVMVEKVDDEFIVRLTSEQVPNLQVNSALNKKMRKENRVSSDDKAYIRQKLESAKWLTRNIEQRQQTILKVSQAICAFQEEFLRKGVEHIRPLTLQVIADEIGVHESTVARTTRGKYIQTPQGLFELKYFFSPGLKKDGGEDQSSKSVQALIQKIVEGESKAKPLSDQKIANALKEQGINCARRTVTKYREQMGIPSTTMRRAY